MATVTITSTSIRTPVKQGNKLSGTLSKFNYYDGDPPEENDVSMFEGRNHHVKEVALPVQDIRSNPTTLTLDRHGAQLLTHHSEIVPAQSDRFYDLDFISTHYWPELRSFVKKAFNARAVFVRDTTVRDASRATKDRVNPLNPRASKSALKPFFIVHADYTPAGGRSHIRAVLPTYFEDNGLLDTTTPEERSTFMTLRSEIIEAEDKAMREMGVSSVYDWDGSNYTGPRYAMFSMWRPLSTVHRDPLGILDATTLRPDQITELPRIYANRPGFVPKYKVNNILAKPPDAEEHKWVFVSEQKPEEMWALKLFDSEGSTKKGQEDGIAKFAAHSAFELDDSQDVDQRRSCEVRVIVIW